MRRKGWLTAAVFALLLTMVVEVGLSTRRQSPSWDEGDHIFSGYMNWKHREYSLNPEHPPLVKLVATLPLLPLDLKIAPRLGRFFKAEAYYGGRELLFRNDPRYGGHYTADDLLFRIHMTVLVFAVTLGLLLFLATQEMFGSTAALFALSLFVFDPTILTNAPFVTTDTGAACGIFAAVYTFYRFCRTMTWPRAALCGLATGLALTAKHSAVLLLPILLLLAAGELAGRFRTRRNALRHDTTHLAASLAFIAAVALFVLWGVYSFRYAMHPTGVYFPPLAGQMASLSPSIRALITFCIRLHLLPESYLYGLVDVQRVGLEMPTYIFGKLYAHGQWFYFPAILSLKFTAGFLILLCLALFAFATNRLQHPRALFFLTLPPAVFLGAAMAGPLNIGVRHVLPLFPFAFALAGAGAATLLARRRAWAFAIAPLLLWHVTDSLRVFPNYLPYANIFWGGPTQTHRFFSDSATDWGQQLKFTRTYLDAHHIQDCWFAYFPAPFLLPSDYGIACKPLPTLDTMYEGDITLPTVVHGPLLISFADLNGFEFGTKVRNPYQALFERTPDDTIANGIAVFHGDFHLPEAAALAPEQHARNDLAKHPDQALAAAREAVALAPNGFDANLVLGDALLATGNKSAALAAFETAARRLPEMEPSARQDWQPTLATRLAKAR